MEAEKTDLEVKLKDYAQALATHVEENEKAKIALVNKCEQLTGYVASSSMKRCNILSNCGVCFCPTGRCVFFFHENLVSLILIP